MKIANNNVSPNLGAIDTITDVNDMKRYVFASTENSLKAGGAIKPDLKMNTDGELDTNKFALNTLTKTLTFQGSSAYDDAFLERRMDFIANVEGGFKGTMHYVNDVPHIGYGVNLEVHKGLIQEKLNFSDNDMAKLMKGEKAITQTQGRLITEFILQDMDKLVTDRIGDIPLNTDQRIALNSMAYNAPALIGPNLVKHIQNGDMDSISNEILNRSNKSKSKGIDNRRKMEHDMFFGSDPMYSKRFPGQEITKGESVANAPNPWLKNLTNLFITPVAAAEVDMSAKESTNGAVIESSPTNNKVLAHAALDIQDKSHYKEIPGVEVKKIENPPIKDSELYEDDMNLGAKFSSWILHNALPETAGVFLRYKGESMGVTGDSNKTEIISGETIFDEQSLSALKELVSWAIKNKKTSIQYQDYDNFFGINDNGLFLSEIVGSKDGINWVTQNVPAEERGLDSYKNVNVAVWDDKKKSYVKKDKGYWIALQQDAFDMPQFLNMGMGALTGSDTGQRYMSYVNLALSSRTNQSMTLGLILGRFNWKVNEAGEIIIEDAYNFTGHKADDANYDKLRSEQDTRGKADPFKFRINLGVL